MMEAIFPDLLLLGDYTNSMSVLIIICCSLGMTLFIYFFRWTGDFPHRTVDFGPQQRSMVKVSNPFVVELDQSTKELGDVLRLNLSTLCPCHVVVVWGPKIQAFHDLILMPGRSVRLQLLSQDYTDLEPLHTDVLQFEDGSKHTISLPNPDCVSSEALGDMPRRRYPLAVFVFTLDRDGNENSSGDGVERDNDIIGLFTIVHLKDSTVSKDSHIIGKYVKTAGVPIYSLQPLFASATDQPHHTSASSPTNSQSQQGNDWSHHPTTSTVLRQRNTPNPSCSLHSPMQNIILNDDNCSGTGNTDETVTGGFVENGESRMHNDNVELSHSENNVESDSFNQRQKTIDEGFQFQRDETTFDCVVCQTNPATCALLPCRHNCVCLRCLRLLDRCPMCRGTMESYFIVSSRRGGESSDEEEDYDDEDEEAELIIRQGMAAQVENMLERVNQMVGFA